MTQSEEILFVKHLLFIFGGEKRPFTAHRSGINLSVRLSPGSSAFSQSLGKEIYIFLVAMLSAFSENDKSSSILHGLSALSKNPAHA